MAVRLVLYQCCTVGMVILIVNKSSEFSDSPGPDLCVGGLYVLEWTDTMSETNLAVA